MTTGETVVYRKQFSPCLNVCPALVCFCPSAGPAWSHDLWLNVDDHYSKAGGKSAVKVDFDHNFPYYDISMERDSLASQRA